MFKKRISRHLILVIALTLVLANLLLPTLLRARPSTSQIPATQPFSQTLDLPALTEQAVKPLIEQAKRVTAQPLTIKADAKSLVLSNTDLVSLLAPKILKTPDGKEIIQFAYDQTKIHAFVDSVSNDASVTAQPTIMSEGKIIRQGTEGTAPKDDTGDALLLAALIERQTGAGNPSEVTIPMIKVAPPVVEEEPMNGTNRTTGTGVIRLTFDDGPGGYTDQILDVLKTYNVHATFYVIGRHIPGRDAQMKRTVSEGHRIGNHSYNHINLTRQPEAVVVSEIASTQTLILQTSGVPATIFRPPFGAQNPIVRNVATSQGLSIDLWSVDPRDWMQPGASVVRDRVLSAAQPGSVVLLHALYKDTLDALPSIIEGLRARGYTLE